jgi:hypothetical protein
LKIAVTLILRNSSFNLPTFMNCSIGVYRAALGLNSSVQDEEFTGTLQNLQPPDCYYLILTPTTAQGSQETPSLEALLASQIQMQRSSWTPSFLAFTRKTHRILESATSVTIPYFS